MSSYMWVEQNTHEFAIRCQDKKEINTILGGVMWPQLPMDVGLYLPPGSSCVIPENVQLMMGWYLEPE